MHQLSFVVPDDTARVLREARSVEPPAARLRQYGAKSLALGQLPTAKAVGLSLPLSKVMLSSARHWLVGRVGSDTPASR